MSPIKKILKRAGSYVSYKYYGINDLATGYDAKFIIENYDFLKSIFNEIEIKPTIKYLDDLRSYFLFQKYSNLASTISYLTEDKYKSIIQDISSKCTEYVQKINTGTIIKYINSNYKRIFNASKRNHELLDVTLDFIFKYGNGINEQVWLFLANKYGYKLIYNYPMIKKYLRSKKYGSKILDKMINIETPEHLFKSYLKDVLDVLADILLNHRNSNLFQVAQRKADQIYTIVDNLKNENVSGKDLLIRINIFHETLNFLKTTKDKRANAFSIKVNSLEDKLDAWIKENGESTSYEIPIGEIINRWRKNKNWEIKLLSLTHDFYKTNSVIAISRLAKYEKTKTILDFFDTNLPTDDYFTYSHQLSLQFCLAVGSGTMLGLLQGDKDIKEYYRLVAIAISYIQGKTKVTPLVHLSQDIEILASSIETIRRNKDNENIQMLYYGTSMLICAITEKLLKIIVEDKIHDVEYIQINSLHLGSMLNPNNLKNPLTHIFGKDHLNHLAFFLCTSGDNRIGHELRNNLAHLSGGIEKRLNDQLLAQLLWIFTDILNTIFWHYINSSYKEITNTKKIKNDNKH